MMSFWHFKSRPHIDGRADQMGLWQGGIAGYGSWIQRLVARTISFGQRLRPCLAQLIFSFFTNLSRSSAKQSASAAAYQFSCFSEYTKSSQQAEAAVHQLLR
jgi:hypothetical protein